MLEQIREALETGLELARQEAATIHETYAGYKPDKHSAVDEDVKQIEDAIAALAAMQAGEPVVHAWFHRGMVNFDEEPGLAKLDDGKGTPIHLFTSQLATSEAEAMLAYAQAYGWPAKWQTPDGIKFGYLEQCEGFSEPLDAIRAAMKGAG